MREPKETFTVRWARRSLIAIGILLGPLYALWLAGGRIADRRGQRRHKPETAARRHRAF